MESVNNSEAKVQHVNKKSSDELLRKFAEMDDKENVEKKKAAPGSLFSEKMSKRRRRSRESGGGGGCDSPANNGHLAERRSLLSPAGPRKSALLRRLGVHSRAHLKAREIRHKSLFGTIEKTWRRTIEGASKVFMEKHYNRHKRLINDIV